MTASTPGPDAVRSSSVSGEHGKECENLDMPRNSELAKNFASAEENLSLDQSRFCSVEIDPKSF